MLLRMATCDHNRRVLQLVAGIVALAVVIGLCVVALVVLLDRFTAGVGAQCPKSGCGASHYPCNDNGLKAVDSLVSEARPIR
ncbi:MAG: hypothetical protein ABI873_17740 [Marmoricola sp.]